MRGLHGQTILLGLVASSVADGTPAPRNVATVGRPLAVGAVVVTPGSVRVYPLDADPREPGPFVTVDRERAALFVDGRRVGRGEDPTAAGGPVRWCQVTRAGPDAGRLAVKVVRLWTCKGFPGDE